MTVVGIKFQLIFHLKIDCGHICCISVSCVVYVAIDTCPLFHILSNPCELMQLEQKHQLAEQEKLTMEAEISLLRSSPLPGRDSPFDMMRSTTLLSDYQHKLGTSQTQIKELESFIIEHVRVSKLSLCAWNEAFVIVFVNVRRMRRPACREKSSKES